jgi:hypothetical protein
MFGEGRNAPPSVDDIARVAAAALMRPDQHAGKIYRPTGPELIGRREVIATMTRVLGRSVHAMPMPHWMFLKAAKLDGLPIQLLSSLEYYFAEHKLGTFEAGAPTDHVREVTGRVPESFEAVAKRHSLLPENRRTAANFAKRFAKFMAVPLVPKPRLSSYLKGLHMPQPDRALLAINSEIWRAEHGGAPSQGSK